MIFRLYSNFFRRPPSSGSYRTRGREVPGKKFRFKGRDFSVLLKLFPTAAVVRELQNERSGGPWKKKFELRDVFFGTTQTPSDGRRRPGATERGVGRSLEKNFELRDVFFGTTQTPSDGRRRPGATEREVGRSLGKNSELRDVISAILGHPSDGRRRPGATEGEDGLTSPSVTRRRPGAVEGGDGERTDANYR